MFCFHCIAADRPCIYSNSLCCFPKSTIFPPISEGSTKSFWSQAFTPRNMILFCRKISLTGAKMNSRKTREAFLFWSSLHQWVTSRCHVAFGTKVNDSNFPERAAPPAFLFLRETSHWIQKYLEKTKKSGRSCSCHANIWSQEQEHSKGIKSKLFCLSQRFHVAYWTQQRSDELVPLRDSGNESLGRGPGWGFNNQREGSIRAALWLADCFIILKCWQLGPISHNCCTF